MSTCFATRLSKMATFFVTVENKKNEMTAVEKSLVARIFHFFVIFASNSRCCHFVFLFFLIFDPLVVFRDIFSHFFDIFENQHETSVFSNPIVPFLTTTNEKKTEFSLRQKNKKARSILKGIFLFFLLDFFFPVEVFWPDLPIRFV